MEPNKKQEDIGNLPDNNNSNIDERKVTEDFDEMVKIVFWNSLGFLFYIFGSRINLKTFKLENIV